MRPDPCTVLSRRQEWVVESNGKRGKVLVVFSWWRPGDGLKKKSGSCRILWLVGVVWSLQQLYFVTGRAWWWSFWHDAVYFYLGIWQCRELSTTTCAWPDVVVSEALRRASFGASVRLWCQVVLNCCCGLWCFRVVVVWFCCSLFCRGTVALFNLVLSWLVHINNLQFLLRSIHNSVCLGPIWIGWVNFSPVKLRFGHQLQVLNKI